MDDFKKMFHNQDDFSTRLHRTILKYKDEFYYSQTTDELYCLSLSDVATGKIIHKNINVNDELENFFFGAATLGLVNIDTEAYLLERAPARRYKAGTPPEYISFQNVKEQGSSGGMDKGRGCFTTGFYNMLHNRYPTVGEAISSVKKNPKSNVAVSRTLFFEMNEIGVPVLVHRSNQPLLWIGPSGTVNMTNSTITRIGVKGSENSIMRIVRQIEETAHVHTF